METDIFMVEQSWWRFHRLEALRHAGNQETLRLRAVAYVDACDDASPEWTAEQHAVLKGDDCVPQHAEDSVTEPTVIDRALDLRVRS